MKNFSIVIISGLSGAGKSNAAKVLEDLGYNTIDNIPLQVVEKIVELFYGLDVQSPNVAFVIDSRSKDSALAYQTILMLKEKYQATLLFMNASFETLLKRYKETRRKHPQGSDLIEAINNEIDLMGDIKDIADIIIDTDNKSVHQLANDIQNCFKDHVQNSMSIVIESFGFKHGVPSDADLMFDVRFLRNPFFDENLKSQTGLSGSVREYVREDPSYGIFLNKLSEMLLLLVPLYSKEGKKYLTIAVGCTGGHHRSVTVAEDLGQMLKKENLTIRLKHRDIER